MSAASVQTYDPLRDKTYRAAMRDLAVIEGRA